MRSERVFTNLTCDQNCTFCTSRASVEDRAYIHPNAVRARIQDAVHAGAREVVLTGGEPTLRRDIADLVSFVKARDARSAPTLARASRYFRRICSLSRTPRTPSTSCTTRTAAACCGASGTLPVSSATRP